MQNKSDRAVYWLVIAALSACLALAWIIIRVQEETLALGERTNRLEQRWATPCVVAMPGDN